MSWTWESLPARLASRPVEILALLNARMKALEQYLGIALSTFAVDAKAYTTDGSATTLATEPIPPSKTVNVAGYVVGRRTGGSAGTAEDAASYRVEFLAKNEAGTATVIGSAVTVIGESQAGWNCAVSASGGSVLVTVTGAANNNITWAWTRKKQTVTNET